MSDSYDEEDYDDHDYDEHDYDHPSLNPYLYYYKFDVGPDHPISKYINNIVNNFMGPSDNYNIVNIPGFSFKSFPVNSWNPDTANSKWQYLGSNYQGSHIWKTQYFVVDKINMEYKLHLQSHAEHFVMQPSYYNGLFEILN